MEFQKEFLANRLQWRSQTSFIVVTAGAVIGISNFWMFPSLMATYGGGAFFLLYLLSIFLVGIPAMFAEMLIGRAGRQNPVSTMQLLAMTSGVSHSWRFLGWWTSLALLLVASFYCVIACISLNYVGHFALGAVLSGSDASTIYNLPTILSQPKNLMLWNAIFIALVTLVVIRGIRHGLEKISYVAVAMLFLVLAIMVIGSVKTPEFAAALASLIHISPQAFTWKAFFAAMNYTFFTLSLGFGSMLVYGSYLPTTANLNRSILVIILLDTLVAVLAYLAISPWMAGQWANATGIEALYSFLPRYLSALPHFHLEGLMFYLMIFLAAWTATISMFEPLVIIMNERLNIPRHAASIIIALLTWILGLGTVFSFNIWRTVHLIGSWNFLDAVSTISCEFMLPIGAIGFCIFAGWRLNRTITSAELDADRYPYTYAVWRFLVRYVAPVGILLVIFW